MFSTLTIIMLFTFLFCALAAYGMGLDRALTTAFYEVCPVDEWWVEWKGWWLRRSAAVRERRRRNKIKLELLAKLATLAPKLEAEEILMVAGEELDVEGMGHWKAAYRWSRRARREFNHPSDNPANRIIVTDWLRKTMESEKVRPGQMLNLLPYAAMLSFVRGRGEQEADIARSIFAEIPGMIATGAK